MDPNDEIRQAVAKKVSKTVAKTVGSLKVGGFPVRLSNDLSDPDNIPFGNLLDLNVREDV